MKTQSEKRKKFELRLKLKHSDIIIYSNYKYDSKLKENKMEKASIDFDINLREEIRGNIHWQIIS